MSVESQAESGLSRVEVEFVDQQVLMSYLEELNAGESAPRMAAVAVYWEGR